VRYHDRAANRIAAEGTKSLTYSVTATNLVGKTTTGRPFTVAVSLLPPTSGRAGLSVTLLCPSTTDVNAVITCKGVVTNDGTTSAANLQAAIVSHRRSPPGSQHWSAFLRRLSGPSWER
jgi:hypothetical protein